MASGGGEGTLRGCCSMDFHILSFFLSGLHWVSGLSELPLEQRLLLLLAGASLFPFFYPFQEEPSFSFYLFCYCGPF